MSNIVGDYGDDPNDEENIPPQIPNTNPNSSGVGDQCRSLLERLGLIDPNAIPDGPYVKKCKKFNMKDLMSLALRKDDLLTGKNWMIWKTNILQALRSTGLIAFPLGKAPAPDKNAEPDEYEAWETLDQAALQFLHSNIRSDCKMDFQRTPVKRRRLKFKHRNRNYK